jgi:hypothetical protein
MRIAYMLIWFYVDIPSFMFNYGNFYLYLDFNKSCTLKPYIYKDMSMTELILKWIYSIFFFKVNVRLQFVP